MKLLLKKARIIDAKSTHHNKVVDILISEGKIEKIAASITNAEAKEIVFDNLHVSNGWIDTSVSLGEPGYEDRETIANGLNVAARSGFTAIALQPNSYPVIDNQSQVSFVIKKAENFATELLPIGALTKGSIGKDMAELFDMQKAGAIAFGDYNLNIENANLLKIALQYAKDFNATIIAYSNDTYIKGTGVSNEGIVSTKLGLKGIPNLAEEIIVARNIALLEYTGGRMHIPTISTAKSVDLIRDAKAKGLKISCSVAVHNLCLTDEKLINFDTRFKVTPPLRTELDRTALVNGVLDNTIDIITSDHNPIDIEHKKMEFDLAKEGTIGLESAFGALNSILPLGITIDKLTAGRNIFNLKEYIIEEGALANITMFTPDGESVFTTENILSKSKNSIFLGYKTKGKVYGIYNNGNLY